MDEILYELRDHAAGLNAGRWDYIFSVIKKFRATDPSSCSPTARSVTMTVPFMRAYTRAARPDLPPARRPRDRRDGRVHPEPPRRRRSTRPRSPRSARTRSARPRRLRRDVGRPPGPRAGRDGGRSTRVLGDRPNQIDRLRDDVDVTRRGPARRRGDAGRTITEAGLRQQRPRRRSSTSTPGCAAPARPRSTT